MAKLLSLRQPPTAVYAHSDEVAFGAIRTLRRAGLRIPQDIAVIGIADHPIADYLDLTTIRQPVREQGVRTAKMLAALLSGDGEVDQGVHVPTQLIVRGSTAPPGTFEGPGRRRNTGPDEGQVFAPGPHLQFAPVSGQFHAPE